MWFTIAPQLRGQPLRTVLQQVAPYAGRTRRALAQRSESCPKRSRRTGTSMANVKKGNLTACPERWKHLDWWKRRFWKRERRAQKAAVRRESHLGPS